MYNYKYSVINRGIVVIRTDNIEFARSGVSELGSKAYVQYNMDLNWDGVKR